MPTRAPRRRRRQSDTNGLRDHSRRCCQRRRSCRGRRPGPSRPCLRVCRRALGAIDHYALLGVRIDASAREIRRAYRRLARRHHPDVNPRPDGDRRFAELAHAYAILNNPAERARYDQRIHRPAPAGQPTMSRSPVVQQPFRRGILELSPSEARHLARHPLTLRDGRGGLIVLPAATRHGEEIILPYDGRVVVVTVQLRGKT